MTVLTSSIDTRSDSFKKNAEAMRALVADLRARTEKVRLGGGEESRKRHVGRGKLLPRERRQSDAEAGSGMPSRRNSVGVMPRRALKARLNGPLEL